MHNTLIGQTPAVDRQRAAYSTPITVDSFNKRNKAVKGRR